MAKSSIRYLKYGSTGFQVGFITGLVTAFFIWTSIGRRIAKLPIDLAYKELERKVSELERKVGLR